MFGENNYKLEIYVFTDMESFNKDCEKINKSNKQIDLDKLKKIKKKIWWIDGGKIFIWKKNIIHHVDLEEQTREKLCSSLEERCSKED